MSETGQVLQLYTVYQQHLIVSVIKATKKDINREAELLSDIQNIRLADGNMKTDRLSICECSSITCPEANNNRMQ